VINSWLGGSIAPSLKILLGIIAVNLTFQAVKDVGFFPTAYAQGGIQRVAICDQNLIEGQPICARVQVAEAITNDVTGDLEQFIFGLVVRDPNPQTTLGGN